MSKRQPEICRFPPGWPSQYVVPPSAFEVAAGKPATVSDRVRPVISRFEYQLTTVVGPGDPFNRQPHPVWDVDLGTVVETWGGLGPNDIEVINVTGGAPRENSTRWDHITFWISKSNTSNDTHFWDVTKGGSRIGYGWGFWNSGAPATRVGRIGDAGPIMVEPGATLAYDYRGVTVPSAASLDIYGYAVGFTTYGGEIPGMTGIVVPAMRRFEQTEAG